MIENAIIEVQGLRKSYKNKTVALDGMSLTVRAGEIYCLLGRNGAGKSTLINILTTYLKHDSGEAKVLGMDLMTEGRNIRRQIACVAQRTSVDMYLSLRDNMLMQGRLYGMSGTACFSRMDDLIDCFDLGQYVKKPVGSYSGGVKRRLDIALNMMSSPEILFLDEPTVGMDVQSRRLMWDMMRKMRDELKTTVFMTTHYLEEAGLLSDTVCIMGEGRAIIEDTPASLEKLFTTEKMKAPDLEDVYVRLTSGGEL